MLRFASRKNKTNAYSNFRVLVLALFLRPTCPPCQSFYYTNGGKFHGRYRRPLWELGQCQKVAYHVRLDMGGESAVIVGGVVCVCRSLTSILECF